MTDTDRLAEMAAEIERQADPRDKLALAQHATLLEAMAEIERLRARIAELESHAAVTFGTLERPTEDEPARYMHNVPPSAPPHDKPLSVIDLNIITAKALEIMSQPEPENDDE